MSKLKATSSEFVPKSPTVGYTAGPPGKETTVFRDVYKNKATGQLVDFSNVDKTSSRPDSSKFEAVTPVSEKKPRGGKSKKRRLHKKKRSTRKH